MQVMALHWRPAWGQGSKTLSDILNGRTSEPTQKGRASRGSKDVGRAAGWAPSTGPSGEHAGCCAGAVVSPRLTCTQNLRVGPYLEIAALQV